MTEYIAVDNRRLSYGELWRIPSTWGGFARGVMLRWLGVRNPPRVGFASNGPHFIEPDSIPEFAAGKLAALVDDCRRLGFTPCYWTTSSSIGPSEGFGVHLLHADRAMYAACLYSRVTIAHLIREELVVCTTTKLADGRYLQTGNTKMRFDAPPGFESVHMPGDSAQAVVEKHQARLARLGVHQIVRLDERAVVEALKEAVERLQKFLRQRGVWVPLSADEISAIVRAGRGG